MQPGISQGHVPGVAEEVVPQCCPSRYRHQLAHHLDAAAAQQMALLSPPVCCLAVLRVRCLTILCLCLLVCLLL